MTIALKFERPRLPSRTEQALAVQAITLELLKKHGGAWEDVSGIKFLCFERGPIKISYRTPFQKLPAESEIVKYMRSMLGGGSNLPYGLDIWHNHKKVMNLEWDDHGNRHLASFRRGDWVDDIHLLLQGP